MHYFFRADNDGYTSQDSKDADGKLEGETLAEDTDADDNCVTAPTLP